MHNKKAWSVLVTLCMALALFAIAVPAQANHTSPDAVSLWMPNDSFDDKDQLSDQFDGVDSAAHLTAVTTADADQVLFFVCTAGAPGQTPYTTTGGTAARNAGCDQIGGADTTGTQPVLPDQHGTPSDEAYEVFWDIPTALDGQTRDIVALACQGAPGTTDTEAPNNVPDNCNQDIEEDIFLEDSSDQSTRLLAGEIVAICTAPGSNAEAGTGGSTAGVDAAEAGANDCYDDANGAFTSTTADRTGFKTTLGGHGSVVPENGFTVRFRTSVDVTDAEACLAYASDANTEPAACDSMAEGQLEQATPTYNQFVATFTDAEVPGGPAGSLIAAEREIDLVILGGTGAPSATTNAQCNDAGVGTQQDSLADFGTDEENECVLDEHYVVSSTRGAASAVASFLVDRQGTANDNNCKNPDDAETNSLGDDEEIVGCLTDQFGDPFPATTGAATFESAGPDGTGFTQCGIAGTFHDHDDDGYQEHCHVDESDDTPTGTWQVTIDNVAVGTTDATPGSEVVTFCLDDEANVADTNPPAATQPTGHGCGEETVKDTVTKTWQTFPEDIGLVFAEEGVAAQDICRTGDTFKENRVGDTETLVACTFDDEGNFVSTTPEDNGRLQWSIFTVEGGGFTATRFVGSPPNETGDDGTATVDIEAFRVGNDFICVEINEDPGGNATNTNQVCVQKAVTESGQETQCSDGVDNDGDGRIDLNDGGCASSEDNSEAGGGPGPGPGPGPTPAACRNAGSGANVITGTNGNDTLVGTPGRDVICGAGGDDVISGRAGNDLIVGNGGDDVIGGGGGKDTANGNRGNDNISGGKGNDAVKGSGGRDTLKGNAGIDTLTGGGANDTLQGGDGQDILNGGKDNDTLRGGAGADALNGGPGNDQCFGNAGNDDIKNCE